MNQIEKAIKACKEEIKFYKDELKQPYLKEYKTTYEAYITGQDVAYSNCVNGIETFEFIISVLQEQQKQQWIPCSERIPNREEYIKNDGRFIVTDGQKVYQDLFDIYTTKTFCKESGFAISVDNRPIAWRELPEKYKEDSYEHNKI